MRRRWAGIASLMAAAALVSGCGGTTKLSGPPTTVLTEALNGLGHLSGVQAVVRLEAPGFHDPDLTAAQNQALLNSRLVITTHTPDYGGLAAEGSSAHPALDVDLSLVVSGDNVAEIRAVDHKIFGRVDLDGLGTELALAPSQRAALSHLQSVLGQDGQHFSGLGALAEGRWVDVPTSVAVTLGNEALVRQGLPLATTTLRPATVGRVVATLMGVVSTSTVGDNGPVTGGESYGATFPTRALVASPLTTLTALAGTLGNSSSVEALIGVAEAIPGAATVQVNFVVAGPRVRQVALPLGQLFPNDSDAENAEIEADLGSGPDLGSPSPSSPIDLPNLLPSLDPGVKV